ncbi:MAG: hypothetical protein R3229_09970 [Alphaproteobacteria bacterium]|nr:hypothetical protein [Alphaproteobacteria bacterium]
MWKLALSLALAMVIAADAATAFDGRGSRRGDAPGWQSPEQPRWHPRQRGERRRADGRGWRRGDAPRWQPGDRRGWRRSDDRRRPPKGNRGWRRDDDRRRPKDDYISPYTRPPAPDRRFDPDWGGRDRARDAYRRGRIVSLDRVMSVVQRRYRGRVLDVRLDNRRLIYHIRLLTRRGRVLRIRVDARTAEILSPGGDRRRR